MSNNKLREKVLKEIADLAKQYNLVVSIDRDKCVFGEDPQHLFKNFQDYKVGKSEVSTMGYDCITYTIPVFTAEADTDTHNNKLSLADVAGITTILFMIDYNDIDFCSIIIRSSSGAVNRTYDMSDDKDKIELCAVLGYDYTEEFTARYFKELVDSLIIPDLYQLLFNEIR